MSGLLTKERLDDFYERLKKLEQRVYSPNREEVLDIQSLSKSVHDAHVQLKEAEQRLPDLKKIFANASQISENCKLCHSGSIEMPSEAKVHYLEATQAQIKEQSKQLETIEKLKPVLDSEHLKTKVDGGMNAELTKLYQVNERLQDESLESLEHTKQLVDAYNKAIGAVSEKFEAMNRLVTKIELERVKVLD